MSCNVIEPASTGHAGIKPQVSLGYVTVCYGRRAVFSDLSMRVKGGEVLAVLGPNGRGKTTLIKAIVGIQALAAGTRDVVGSVGYVPQSTLTTFDFSVREIVMMGRARHIGLFGSPQYEDHLAVDAALRRLNLADLADRSLSTLSGGERQLVTIARALAGSCNILVLDEPASALDLKNQRVLFDILRELAIKDGMVVIFSTHVPGHAFAAADIALLMHSAGEFEIGCVDEVLTDTTLTRLYGTPVRVVVATGDFPRMAAAIAV